MIMIRNFIVFLVFILLVGNVKASENLFNINHVYFETEKMVKTNRGYYIPEGSEPNWNFNLGIDLKDRFKGLFYSRNVISSTTDQSQFRYIALDTEFGIDTTIGIEIYVRHYSGHMLDADKIIKFPEENVVGMRFHLINE